MKSILLRVARGTSRMLSKVCSPCASSSLDTVTDQPAAQLTPVESTSSLHLEDSTLETSHDLPVSENPTVSMENRCAGNLSSSKLHSASERGPGTSRSGTSHCEASTNKRVTNTSKSTSVSNVQSKCNQQKPESSAELITVCVPDQSADKKWQLIDKKSPAFTFYKQVARVHAQSVQRLHEYLSRNKLKKPEDSQQLLAKTHHINTNDATSCGMNRRKRAHQKPPK